MLYAGALDKKTVGEIVQYNQNNSKLSHLGVRFHLKMKILQ